MVRTTCARPCCNEVNSHKGEEKRFNVIIYAKDNLLYSDQTHQLITCALFQRFIFILQGAVL